MIVCMTIYCIPSSYNFRYCFYEINICIHRLSVWPPLLIESVNCRLGFFQKVLVEVLVPLLWFISCIYTWLINFVFDNYFLLKSSATSVQAQGTYRCRSECNAQAQGLECLIEVTAFDTHLILSGSVQALCPRRSSAAEE